MSRRSPKRILRVKKNLVFAVSSLSLLACVESIPLEGSLTLSGPQPERNPIVTPANDAGVPAGADGGESPPTECNIKTVFAASGCSNGGCHAPPVQASLDLMSPDLAARLINAPSHVAGCDDRKIIDPEKPEESLLLQSVGAVPPVGGSQSSCNVVMPPPPWGQMPTADVECLTSWLQGVVDAYVPPPPVNNFEPVPITSAMRKVKGLLNGNAPTETELLRIQNSEATFQDLVNEWAEGPQFARKLSNFFEVALQQRFQIEDLDQFDRLRRHSRFNAPFVRILEESFVRTAIGIVERGDPFTEILTTRRWQVTTANLALLLYPDQTRAQRTQRHLIFSNAEDAPNRLSEQISQRRWYIPSLETDCDISQTEALDMLFGYITRNRCTPRPDRNPRFTDSPLTLADFEDWREVEFVPAGSQNQAPTISFYNIEALRSANRVSTNIPRVGFFTTSAFFNNWPTNVDNQFRVTTNQTLLGALHIGFSSSEPTVPLLSEGLDEAHATPGSSCHGCHRQLDPMRVYFAQAFNLSYQTPTNVAADQLIFDPMPRPSLAFRGVTATDGSLYDFAQRLASHPRFPVAWAQKLCLYANSKRCNEQDPVFVEIVDRFRTHLNFKRLLTELFSSPLITGLAQTETWQEDTPIISISRREHMCAMLDERTGEQGVCNLRNVEDVLGLIPRDEFARGAVDPAQPTQSNSFHFAAAEAICEAVAESVVTQNAQHFSISSPEQAIERMVTHLMGLSRSHHRYTVTLDALKHHHQTLLGQSFDAPTSLRSTFALACLSPDVMGLGL